MSTTPYPSPPTAARQTLITPKPRPKYPSDLARAERRRKQKEAAREEARSAHDPRQRAIDFAQRLICLAEEYPEFREETHKFVDRVHVRANTSPDRDGDAVMRAIEVQGCRYDWEIAEDTHLQLKDVRTVLLGFVVNGRLKKYEHDLGTQYVPTGKQGHPMMNP